MKNIKTFLTVAAMLVGVGLVTQPSSEQPIVEVSLTQSAFAEGQQPAAAPVVAPVAGQAASVAAPAAVAPVAVPPPIVDVANPDKPIENQAFLEYLWKSFNGWKGLGAMGIAAFLTQILAAFMLTPFFSSLIKLKKPIEEWMGKWKLALVLGLAMLSGISMLIATGLDWKAALVHSSTLATFQVFAHQVWKQASEKKPA